MKLRLSFLMFMQFFTLGATAPIFSHYLKDVLNFSGTQTGAIISISALAALVSPLAGALIADRLLASKHLYALCHLIAGSIMFALSYQTGFIPFFCIFLLYTLVFGPTNALTSALVFHELPAEKKLRFGSIRVWGTVGWIAVAWVFGYGWLRGAAGDDTSRLADALRLSAICSWLLAVYSLTLPRTKIHHTRRQLLPEASLQILKRKEVRILIFIYFCSSFLEKYFYFGMAPHLKSLGFEEADIMPAMTIAQFPEIAGMLALGWLLSRFGFRCTMLIGVGMHFLRFAVLTLFSDPVLILLGIACHGGAYTFLFVPASIKIDTYCSTASRSGVHLITAIASVGIAGIVSNNVAGIMMDIAAGQYKTFWALPAGLTVLLFAFIWLSVPAEPESKQKSPAFL